MEDHAKVPATSSTLALARLEQALESATVPEHHWEPVAEHNFARKRLMAHERTLEQMRHEARQQHEIVSELGVGMKSMVSELDLRRAIGLALQEFESRLEDAFQDSNRKHLAMFAKREEILEVQGLIGKKVNWTDHSAVLKKLTELRQYVDTMAQSMFVGHAEQIKGEISMKADSAFVHEALNGKADYNDVSNVKARLERLEGAMATTEEGQSKQWEDLRVEVIEQGNQMKQKVEALFHFSSKSMAELKESQTTSSKRLGGIEGELVRLGEIAKKMAEAERSIRINNEQLMSTLSSLQDQSTRSDAFAEKSYAEFKSVQTEMQALQSASDQRLKHLTEGVDANNDRLEFLLQATETLKRKSKEAAKAYATKFDEVASAQEKCTNQIAALERNIKRHEREVRAIDNRVSKADAFENNTTSGLRALLPPGPPDLCFSQPHDAPNDRLKGILDQLEAIASGGHPFESMGVCIDPRRPPLPYTGSEKTQRGIDLTTLPRMVQDAAVPADSLRGAYGMSPRQLGASAIPMSARAPRKTNSKTTHL